MKTFLAVLLLTTFPVIGGDHLSSARIALSHGDFDEARQLLLPQIDGANEAWHLLNDVDAAQLEAAKVAYERGELGAAAKLMRSRQDTGYVTVRESTTGIRLGLSPIQPSDPLLDELTRYPFPALDRCKQLPGIPGNYDHYKNNSARFTFDGFILEIRCQHSSGQPYWSNRTMLQKLIPSQPIERLSELLKPVDIEEGPLFVTVNYRLAKEGDRELKATVLFRSEDQTPYLVANTMTFSTPSLTRDESKLPESFPYYVLSHWSGAMHCCYTALFVEKTFPYNVVHQYFSGNTHWSFKDLDHDGLPELVTGDDAYAYWPGAFVGSPLHRLIWRITPQGLKLAPDLLEEPLPEAIFLSESKQAVRQAMHSDATSDQWVYPLVYMTQGLIYSGHESQAWKYFDGAWPSEASGHDEFKTEFKALVCQSYFAHSMTDKELSIYLKETCEPGVIRKKHPITWSAIASS